MILKDKVAVITGSSRGMGRLVAIDMAKVIVNGIRPSHKTRLYDNVPDEVFKKILASRMMPVAIALQAAFLPFLVV